MAARRGPAPTPAVIKRPRRAAELGSSTQGIARLSLELEGRAPVPTTGFLHDKDAMRAAFEALKAAVGVEELRLLELIAYPEFVVISAQSAQNPTHIDRYVYRDGAVLPPKPVRLMSMEKKNLQQRLFTLTPEKALMTPHVKRDLLTVFRFEGVEATHMILKRWLPFTQNVLWRGYVTGPRDSGSATYDLRGERKRVYR